MKKTLTMLLLVVALTVACLTGCNLTANDETLMDTAASVVTLDVNPSVRVYLASDDTVLEVEALTEDGEDVVAEVEASLEGETLDTAVEVIVDKLFDKGYLGDESNSVLVSVEKQAKELKDTVSEKIKKTFEKHGKDACVIMQELDELEKGVSEQLDELAKKYNVSRGKARMIEKIREDFPELSEEELAELKMNDLALVFNGASEKIRGEFEKIGDALEDMYVGAEAALATALLDAELTEDALVFKSVRISREGENMVYEVEFATETNEYEYELDAKTGEILDSETEERELPDVDGELDRFYEKHGDIVEDILGASGFDKEKIDSILGGLHGNKNPETEAPENDGEDVELISRGEAIAAVLEALGITEENVKDTRFRIHEGKNGMLISVTVELNDGTVYRANVEAFTGMIISAQVNGIDVPLGTGTAEGSTDETVDETTEDTTDETAE